jgi:hypothetical protein
MRRTAILLGCLLVADVCYWLATSASFVGRMCAKAAEWAEVTATRACE